MPRHTWLSFAWSDIQLPMSSPKASGSVIAAAILAIVGSLFSMLGILIALMGLYLTPAQKGVPELTYSILPIIFFFGFGMAIWGMFTGVGLLRLRNWARISAMIWAGFTVFFCFIALVGVLLIPFPVVPNAQGVNMHVVKGIMALIYVFPILIGVWWLILFNRPSTKSQFTGSLAPASVPSPQLRRCPLPVAIIAGFMLFSVLGMFAMPLLHMPVFMILFGHRMRGEFGNFLFAFTTVLYLASAIGLLRLKRWSYPLSLGLYGFWALSGLVTSFSPNYKQILQESFSEMHMPESSAVPLQFMSNPVFALFSLIPTIIIVCVLLYYRKRFWAASAPTSSST